MQLEDRSQCITDFGFDQWFAQDASPEQRACVAEHLRGCTRCRVRGELLEREREAFLAAAPTIAAQAELARHSRRAPRPRATFTRVAFGLSASAIILVAMLIGLPALREHTHENALVASTGERLKGSSAQIGFYVKRGTRVQRGASGDTVRAGDQLRFTYSSAAPAYLALLGRDQSAASVYFPAGTQAARVEGGHDRALDFSLELDQQPGDEHLYVVLCPNEYALAPLREALERDGDLPALAGCRVERIALHKETAP